MVALHVSVYKRPPGKACKVEKHTKNCRQQRDVVQHLPIRQTKQDTLIPRATVSLSEQHLAKSLKAAAQNQQNRTFPEGVLNKF